MPFSFSVPSGDDHHYHNEELSELRARMAALESRVNDLFSLFSRMIGPMPGQPQTMQYAEQPGGPLPIVVDPTPGPGRRAPGDYRQQRESQRQAAEPHDLTAEAGV